MYASCWNATLVRNPWFELAKFGSINAVWSTINRTAYATESSWGRDKHGVHEWLVAVRATFDIQSDGRVSLADEQPPPLLAAEHSGNDGVSSLRYEADVVGPKPTTDVLLNGTAYAPGGRPTSTFDVVLRVGRMNKTLRAIGDRVWQRQVSGIGPSTPQPTSSIPICYERAFGGADLTDPDPKKQYFDSRNPIGKGVADGAMPKDGQALHNFEYPNGKANQTGPAGFGAICSHWSPRRELQGTYDQAWENSRSPLLPLDWDPRSICCAPADQQAPAFLRGGEPVELINLTPSGLLRFELPKIYLTFITHFSIPGGRRSEEHRARLSSVIIEPDDARLVMVWVSSLIVRGPIDYLDETVVREKPFI